MTPERRRLKPRYADFAHLIEPKGKVWRYPDDPPGTWKLCWNDTMPIPEAELRRRALAHGEG